MYVFVNLKLCKEIIKIIWSCNKIAHCFASYTDSRLHFPKIWIKHNFNTVFWYIWWRKASKEFPGWNTSQFKAEFVDARPLAPEIKFKICIAVKKVRMKLFQDKNIVKYRNHFSTGVSNKTCFVRPSTLYPHCCPHYQSVDTNFYMKC